MRPAPRSSLLIMNNKTPTETIFALVDKNIRDLNDIATDIKAHKDLEFDVWETIKRLRRVHTTLHHAKTEIHNAKIKLN